MLQQKNFFKKKYNYLILGSNGLLGSEIKKILPSKKNLFVSRNKSDLNLDLCKFENLKKLFNKYSFNVVVNCAAETDINFCEKYFRFAKKINSDLLKYLTYYSKRDGFKLVHISTDHFFINKFFMYNDEKQKIFPINKYSLTKIYAENYTLKNPKNLVVRTNFTGFVGFKKKTFISWLLKNLIRNNKIKLYNDMYTSTLDVKTCAKIIKKLVYINAVGIYNVGAKDAISKKDFALLFAKAMKKKINYIEASVSSSKVKRGKFLGLDVSKVEKALSVKMPYSKHVVKNIVKHIKKKI
jgi:dTDP-4-dehydrorhamnose reductase